MFSVETLEERIAAVLHDVVEDTRDHFVEDLRWDFGDLEREAFRWQWWRRSVR